MSVVERLNRYMIEHNYTKADVARLSNIPYTTIDGLFKKGDENIKLSTLKKLAILIGCSLDELVGSEPPKYYKDRETAALAQFLLENPDFHILLDASRNLNAEDLKAVAEVIMRLKKNNYNEAE